MNQYTSTQNHSQLTLQLLTQIEYLNTLKQYVQSLAQLLEQKMQEIHMKDMKILQLQAINKHLTIQSTEQIKKIEKENKDLEEIIKIMKTQKTLKYISNKEKQNYIPSMNKLGKILQETSKNYPQPIKQTKYIYLDVQLDEKKLSDSRFSVSTANSSFSQSIQMPKREVNTKILQARRMQRLRDCNKLKQSLEVEMCFRRK